jgi:outer membrane protein assembly factor BamD
MKRRAFDQFLIRSTALLAFSALLTGCKSNADVAYKPDSNSAEPDKLLYEHAMNDVQHGRMTVGRLELQTLLNTYPDSEYQAKAKLAVADSFYKEGGTTGLTQSIAEYQDFITFFPFLDEAAYAQSQIGMAHYRRMEKPDRDREEALEAEGAFQTFLTKYPNSPLFTQQQQRLREVQEVLAEGEFRIAQFYYIRGVFLSSAARLTELVDRYPLYSQADRANWMLASIYERTEHNDYAGAIYARIVKDYPLSPLAADAKAKLQKFGQPVPTADPTALARMQTEQNTPRQGGGLLTRSLGMLKTAPNVGMAARSGTPNMTPQPDGATLTAIAPPKTVTTAVGANGTAAGATGTGAFIQTVTPGSSATATAPVVSTPVPSSSFSTPDANAGDSASQGSQDAQPAAASAATAPATSPAADPKSESSSKKKKGLKKVIPF